jgi:hypothetical protein
MHSVILHCNLSGISILTPLLLTIPHTDLWSLNVVVLNYFPLILWQTLRALNLRDSGANKRSNKIPEQPRTLSSKQWDLHWNQMSPRVSNFGIRQFIAHFQTGCFLRRPHTLIVAASAIWFTVLANANSQKYTLLQSKILKNFHSNLEIWLYISIRNTERAKVFLFFTASWEVLLLNV